MKHEIESAFKNIHFLLGVGLMLVSFLGMSIPEWIISVDWGDEFRQSALQQSVMGIFFGGVMLLMPFCASIPYATNQVEELQSSVMQWKLLRSSIRTYAVRKIISTALSGGAAVALAFILHAILWNFVAYPCDIVAHPYHEIPFSSDCLYSTWYTTLYGLPMYLSMSAGIFICGAVWAVVALSVSVWVPDKLLTITIPACIYYLLSASIFRTLFGWRLPHPATLYNDMLSVDTALFSLLEYAIIFAIACAGYVAGIKRRARNA